MPKHTLGKHYIREWREYRGLSLRRLALRMEQEPGVEMLSAVSLNRIERGLQPYSEPILEALAARPDGTPWALLSVNPDKEGVVVDLLRHVQQLSAEDAARWLKMMKAVGD